jgi:hypothetical protein
MCLGFIISQEHRIWMDLNGSGMIWIFLQWSVATSKKKNNRMQDRNCIRCLGLLYEQYSHVQPIVQTAGMRKDPWSEQSLVSVVLKLQRSDLSWDSWGRTDSFGSPERHGDPWRCAKLLHLCVWPGVGRLRAKPPSQVLSRMMGWSWQYHRIGMPITIFRHPYMIMLTVKK